MIAEKKSPRKLISFPQKPEASSGLVHPNGVPILPEPGPRVVFVGRAGAGKDTAALQLGQGFCVEKTWTQPDGTVQPYAEWREVSSTGGPPYCQLAIADPLRAMASAGFGIPAHVFEDRELKEKPGIPGSDETSPRQLLRILGLALRDSISPDLLVKVLLYLDLQLNDKSPDTTLAVTDCRFGNEFDALRDAWKHRALFIGIYGREPTTDADRTEQEIDELLKRCDLTIYNGPDVPLEDFGRKIRESVLHWFPQLNGRLVV